MSDEVNTISISGVSDFFIKSGALNLVVNHTPPSRSRISIEVGGGGAYLFVQEVRQIDFIVASLGTF